MNKTININLANTFFHIDEEAYHKLQRYLEAIRRSFTDSQGRDEIIADIEARIAELFIEKIENERQVISMKEVDEVIATMGQPEDYLLDEEIFEEEPSKRAAGARKKLYRDPDNKYVAGVSSGLGHYLGINALWMRILFVVAVPLTSGFSILAYFLFWILTPPAQTTAEKLAMTGKPVNISNIEKKVREGFDEVTETIKNVDYEKVGNQIKTSSKTVFETLGEVLIFLLKVLAKFIGILFIIIGAVTLIGLFIGLFSAGIFGMFNIPGGDLGHLVNTLGIPIWLISLLAFLAVGIPFFFLFYLGLKILVGNLKSIGKIAKFTLLGVWLISLLALILIGGRQISEHANTGSISVENPLLLQPADSLKISMNDEHSFDQQSSNFGLKVVVDGNGNELLLLKDVRFSVKKTTDTSPYIKVRKDAQGPTGDAARKKAGAIDYAYELRNGAVYLNNFFTTPVENKFRDQEVTVDFYLPVGTVLSFDPVSHSIMGYGIRKGNEFSDNKLIDHYWKMGENGRLECLDCESLENDDEHRSEGHFKLDKDGLDINFSSDSGEDIELKITGDSLHIDSN